MAHYDDPYSLSCCGMDPVAGHSPRCSTNNPEPVAHVELVERLTGRARFCRDRGEIKTPELLEGAAAELTRLRAQLAAYKAMAEEMADALAPFSRAQHIVASVDDDWIRCVLSYPYGGIEAQTFTLASLDQAKASLSRYQAMKDQADG